MAVLAAARPRFGKDDAVRVARELYGLEASAEELPSERDRNFLLRTARGAFVLKVSASNERPEVLDMQNRALLLLAEKDPDLPLPRILPSGQGDLTAPFHSRDGSRHAVRLLTHLPGTTLAQARPHPPELLSDIGRFLGRLDRALEGFSHEASRRPDLDWDPAHSLDVIGRHAGEIPERDRRETVGRVVEEFRRTVEPLLEKLPLGVIHNDANDHNLLVGEPRLDGRALAGLVDFGDMLEAWTVCEPAVAIAYAMLGEDDPLSAACRVAAGYHETRPLSENEIAALWPMAAVRLCVSVCLSAHRRSTEPGDGYLLVSEAPAWQTLERMDAVHPRLARYRLREACGLPPCPESPAIQAWLSAHPEELGRVVDADLSTALVFDFSPGSPELESPERSLEVAVMTPRLFGAMRKAGVRAGIGRYDEPRLFYATDAFATAGGERPERRTVHLAVDIFMEPGSPVFAPLPGRVHSLRDNAARLDYGPTIVLEHEPPNAPRFFTLYGHLARESLASLSPGAPVERGGRLGAIGSPPENGDWPPHVHFQIVADMLDRDGDFPGVAAPCDRSTWLSLSPDPNLILRMPAGRVAVARVAPERVLAERRRLLGPSLSLSYRTPLEIVRGSGTFLYDGEGRAYLDGVNNVAHVGHCHPRVVRAGARQMAVLNTNTRYLHPSILRYAERLAATLPEPLSVCFFVCSGSEANELALRMARARTAGRGVVVVEGAYHGNTQGLIEVSPYKCDGPGGRGVPHHVRKVPMPDDYRGLYRRDDPTRGDRFAGHVREACEALSAAGHRPAAFLCESLMSCGGQVELPPGYLAAAYRHAREAGAVCIADEVQVGFGRVGDRFWGFQTQGVVPDIVTMGKPIGNGHPLGAVVTTREVAEAFANGMEYFNTFGGNPVSCEIGLAVLDVLRDEGLQQRARSVGARLKAGLAGLQERHPALGDVRGLGLFLGVELVADPEARTPAAPQAAYVVERMKDHGILLSTDGPDHNVIKIKPPLTFSEADAERLVAALDRVLAEDFVRRAVRGG
jgi:4-aminobutyrate aminotransferase-like enzyme/Ser/Thr protein kinase RdoA (MazF antagonist)/murein DD-endopeptidase MepM/ murein hydrolase activator NlpD